MLTLAAHESLARSRQRTYVMGEWKKLVCGDRFQVKLPALNNSEKNCVVVKYEIPRLTKTSFPKRSPNYLPKLSNSLSHGAKVHEHANENLLVHTERNKLGRVNILPSIHNLTKSCDLRPYQPSWFKVFSVKYEQKRRWVAKNVSWGACGRGEHCKCKTGIEEGKENSRGIESKTNYTLEKKGLDAAKQDEDIPREYEVVEKKHSGYELDEEGANTAKRQITVPTKVGMVSSKESIVKNPKHEKCWIPNEHRRRLLGPKEFGVNEEQFLKCVTKNVHKK